MGDLSVLFTGTIGVNYADNVLDHCSRFQYFNPRLVDKCFKPKVLKLATIEYAIVRLKIKGIATPRLRGIFEQSGYQSPYLLDLLSISKVTRSEFWGIIADRKVLVALTPPVLLHTYDPHVPVMLYQLEDEGLHAAPPCYQRHIGLWPLQTMWDDEAFLVIKNRRYAV